MTWRIIGNGYGRYHLWHRHGQFYVGPKEDHGNLECQICLDRPTEGMKIQTLLLSDGKISSYTNEEGYIVVIKTTWKDNGFFVYPKSGDYEWEGSQPAPDEEIKAWINKYVVVNKK